MQKVQWHQSLLNAKGKEADKYNMEKDLPERLATGQRHVEKYGNHDVVLASLETLAAQCPALVGVSKEV